MYERDFCITVHVFIYSTTLSTVKLEVVNCLNVSRFIQCDSI